MLYPPSPPSQIARDLLAPPQPAFGQLSRRHSTSLRALDDPFVGSSTTQHPPVVRSPFHDPMRRYRPEGPLVTSSGAGDDFFQMEGNDNDTASRYSRSVGPVGSSVGDLSDGASVRLGPGRGIGSNMTGRGLFERYDNVEVAPTITRQDANEMARGGYSTAAALGDSSSANVIYTPPTSQLSRSGPSVYSSYLDNLSDIPPEALSRHRRDLRAAGILTTPPTPTPPPVEREVLSGDDLRTVIEYRAAAIDALTRAVSEDAEVIPATPAPAPPPLPSPSPPPLPPRRQPPAPFPRRFRRGCGARVFWVSFALCLLFPPTGLIIGCGYGDWIAWLCTGGRSVGFIPRQMRLARWVGFGLTAVYIVLLVCIVVYRGVL